MRGDLHIGGVMIQLVDSLGNTPQPQTATCSAVESSEKNAKACEKREGSLSEVKNSCALKCICPAGGQARAVSSQSWEECRQSNPDFP